MRRCVRFFPVILAALALATSGSTTFLRQANAQKGAVGGTQKGGAPKGGATLSVEAQQQISALLREKQSRTPEQKKINSHLLNAMRVMRGETMTAGGEVSKLSTAMSFAKSAMDASNPNHLILVNI